MKKKAKEAAPAAPHHGGAREGAGRPKKRTRRKMASFKFELQTLKDLKRLATARKKSMSGVIETLIADEVESIVAGRHGRTWAGRQTSIDDFTTS